MIKRIYISMILITLSSIVFGQFVGKDNFSKSMFYLQKQEIDSAKKYIDLSMADKEQASQLKTLFYKGYIYKEMYKKRDQSKRVSAFRNTAIVALRDVLEKDVEDKFLTDSKKMLNYLASTLYNDAALSLNDGNYSLSKTNYNSYRKIIALIKPDADLDAQDVKFKMALASTMGRKVDANGGVDSLGQIMIKELYAEVLVIDSNNANASYNIAILYYNEGADLINAMDYDMDLETMSLLQDKCVDLFLKGLPYMEKAYSLNYKKQETLLGLSNIYYGLNDDEKSAYYKKELEAFEAGDNPKMEK